jgi:hypothetical protein
MLFDIGSDPYEQINIAEMRVDICKEAVYRLNEWHDNMMLSMNCDVDPLWTVMNEGGPFHARGALPKFCEFLEKIGRADAAKELQRKHPREMGHSINPMSYAREVYIKNLFRGLDKRKK